jgi:aminoglycoside-2''-adenylyltransferase
MTASTDTGTSTTPYTATHVASVEGSPPGHERLTPGNEMTGFIRQGKITPMNEKTEGQLRVIRRVIAVARAADISVWLFGGWGLDARIGRITREHGDVEFWVERVHAERSKAVLVGAGAAPLTGQPPEEACEFTWDDVPFSTAYFDRMPDGSFSQPLGRWSDWLFPPGSFGDEPGTLDGAPVPAMSVSGMLAMKEQYPHLRNGRPWRQKDIADIAILRRLAAEERAG